ncbi:uroplakin-2 [Clupea harengus]|uniref:Uroplakin-2 n=1 Tax=Clupea harengus TaxID=7950 RepID=A0A6P3VQA1_CLUHA|nr:uroplakin-2 [Clupea harengus]
MLTTLLFVGALFTLTNAEFTVRVLKEEDGVVTGIFTDSLLLSLPPCSLEGQNVSLAYNDSNNKSWILEHIFIVPSCGNMTGTGREGHLVTSNIGLYKVSDLASGTNYSFQYHTDLEKSNVVTASTRSAQDYSGIDTVLPARSGSMIVITVILSVAMAFLLVALTITIVLSNDED